MYQRLVRKVTDQETTKHFVKWDNMCEDCKRPTNRLRLLVDLPYGLWLTVPVFYYMQQHFKVMNKTIIRIEQNLVSKYDSGYDGIASV